MVLDLEFYIDPLCFGSNMHVGCVALYISFPKCLRSSKSEFGAKTYSRFSAERSVTGRWGPVSGQHLRVWSQRLVSGFSMSRSDRTLGESS